jgi:uncharacterized protein YkwD
LQKFNAKSRLLPADFSGTFQTTVSVLACAGLVWATFFVAAPSALAASTTAEEIAAPSTQVPATAAEQAAAEQVPRTEATSAGGETMDRGNIQQVVDVFNRINVFRASKGVPAFTFNATVSEMAEDWSDHMAGTGDFSHNPSFYSDARVAGRWTTAGEIIAARGDSSGSALVEQWIASPPHNALMSDPSYTTIGIGIARTGGTDPWTLNMFGTVNLFNFASAPAGGYATAQNFFDATADDSPLSFSDVPAGTDFATEINWLASRGISTGWDEGNGITTYRPLTRVSREAMAAFMYRLAGKPVFTPPAASPFIDVDTGHKFYKEISWLAEQGVTAGWDEGNGKASYWPKTQVNRDAMAAFMYRLADEPIFTPPPASPFIDVDTGNLFYKEITWLATQGISAGWDEGNGKASYRPLTSVNRDAMAAFMYRYNLKFGIL